MSYITTNIRFPEDLYLALKEEALHKRMSLSAIVREKVGVKEGKRTESAIARLVKQLDLAGATLGKKLQGFDVVSALRTMREEER